MKKLTWKRYAVWVLFVEAVGGLSGWLTREGTKIYNATVEQPPYLLWVTFAAYLNFGVWMLN